MIAQLDNFVNLHSHTQGSFLDAIVKVPDLFARIWELGQRTVCVTDHGVCASFLQAYQEYKKYKEQGKLIKFIPGNEIYFCEDLSDSKGKRRHLVLLAANEVGYRNLLKITAAGFQNSVTVMGKEFPRVDAAILKKHNDGLFATSACGGSIIAAHIFGGDREAALKAALQFKDIFGDRFFIELQPHDLSRNGFSQTFLNDQLKSIAEELDIEMVATCDSHYLTAAHEKYHDMILAISDKKSLDDQTRHRYASIDACIVCKGEGTFPSGSSTACHGCLGTKIGRIRPCAEFYVKTGSQVRGFFAKHYDSDFAQKLIDNTAKIAGACGYPDYMEPKGVRLPTFPWADEPDAVEYNAWKNKRPALKTVPDDAAYLRFKVWKAFNIYCKDFDKNKKTQYWNRVIHELDILEARNFSSYMLIVADYVNWAKKQGIVVGVGRGSVSGCLVAFFLNIHAADSIKYGLIFERFQNKEKKSLPDIDVDIAPSGRDRVIEYCKNKYGADKVAAISNINKLTPKVVIKDVARSLVIGGDRSTAFQIANDITAEMPDKVQDKDGNDVKVETLEQAMDVTPKLVEFLHQYPEVLDYARELVGLPRAWGVHAAGVIISDIPLDEIVPLRRDKHGVISVQYDKDACEIAGLAKMDFLGLDTLDIMQETVDMAKSIGIDIPMPDNVPEDDQLAFKLIQTGNVGGIFQLAGSLAPLCKALKPNNVPDIAIVNALGRPSFDKEQRMDCINRKLGKTPIKYTHPILEPVLKNTYGMCVYEEDLAKIASHVAGWDLSKADSLRKLTKDKEKGASKIAKIKDDFIADAVRHSKLTKLEAEKIWEDEIGRFSGYGFNCSHATVYSMISYQTAYYKAHATGPFFCALINAETRGNKRDKYDAIEALKKDARRFGIQFTTCDVNVSKQYYMMRDRKTIVKGLGAIKGLGDTALDAIIANQPYKSFEDFLYRTPSRTVSKSVIVALAKAGAFDSLGVSRKFASEHYADIRKEMIKFMRKHGADSNSNLLAGFIYKRNDLRNDEWNIKDKLTYEKEVIGEYVSGTAEDIFPNFFKGGVYAQPLTKIANMPVDSNFALEGIISSIREIIIKKAGKNQGKAMARLLVENMRGESIEITLWPDIYSKFKKLLQPGIPLRGLFKINEWNGTKSLSVVNLEAIYKEVKE